MVPTMRFEQLDSQLQTGDIVLFYSPFNWKRPMSYLSAAIRFFAAVRYNHAAVYVSNWGVGFINEAVGRGLVPEIASHRLRNVSVKILRPPADYNKKEEGVARKANSLLGYTRYDFAGTLWFQLLFNLFGKKKWFGPTSRKAAMDRMYCYEYAAWVHEDIFPYWWKIDLESVVFSPKMFVVYEGNVL